MASLPPSVSDLPLSLGTDGEPGAVNVPSSVASGEAMSCPELPDSVPSDSGEPERIDQDSDMDELNTFDDAYDLSELNDDDIDALERLNSSANSHRCVVPLPSVALHIVTQQQD
eukprot:397188-Pyramimonas_sp.AAC.1